MIQVTLTQDQLPAQFDGAGFDTLVGAGIANVMLNYHAAMDRNDSVPRDTGALRQSIPATISVSGNIGTIGTPLLYGLVMEKGRRPGKKMPPVDALIPWVKRKIRPHIPFGPSPAKKAAKEKEKYTPLESRREIKTLQAKLLRQKSEGASKKARRETIRAIRKISRKVSRSMRRSQKKAGRQIRKKFRARGRERRKAVFKKLGREQAKKLRARLSRIKMKGRQNRKAKKEMREKAKAEANAAVERADRRNETLRSVAFRIARSIAKHGITVPLKTDGRGAMFQRTHDATSARFAGWFLEPFGARKAG